MTSLQDRSIPNRIALDKWSKREQLCLASAVSCSGDQNWMTVSRSLKLLCGTNHPPDWFSQKLCAVKYGELLENVETPKRKKRTTSDNAAAAPSIAETPTDSILRRLTEERIQELKSEIREQQETYAKLYTDVVHLQTGNSNEEQIRAMWMEIEREQEQDRKARARKQQQQQQMSGGQVEMSSRNWRQGQQQFHIQQQQMTTPVKQDQDMDIDETCKPQGTSPLLSSLLKSSSPSSVVATTPTTSTVRVNAPTITNLLTGVVSSTVSAPSLLQQSSSFQNAPLSKPLTGPGPGERHQTPAQAALSPSQSAPTLSMLLEKNKALPKDQPPAPQQNKQLFDEIKSTAPQVDDASPDVNTETDEPLEEDEPMEDGTLTPTKEEEQQLMEVFKNLMPDNIDELAEILTNNHGILNPAILEEESILEGVESLMDENQEVDDDQLDVKPEESGDLVDDSKNPKIEEKEVLEEAITKTEIKDIKEEKEVESDEKKASKVEEIDVKEEKPPSSEEEEDKTKVDTDKIETISSDDSSDNVPLSSHTSNNTKDDKPPSVVVTEIKDDVSIVVVQDTPTESPMVIDEEDSQPEAEIVSDKMKEEVKEDGGEVEAPQIDDDVEIIKTEQPSSLDNRKDSMSDSSDVIIIPTDDESNDGKVDVKPKKSNDTPAIQVEEQSKSVESIAQTNEIEIETSQEAITSICLPDTDDESTNFEAPSTSFKDEKFNSSKQPVQNKKPESSSQIDQRSEEEVKPALTAVRKLRDRDRSESPLVEDDTSDNSTTQRLRRRYSSTPVIDSIPNSPASGDDRELKVWKKSLMTVYNNLLTNKNASIFLRPITDEQNPLFKQVCRRPMDLQIIKRHIENGTIRNITDFQRDVFLMCQNVIITFKKSSSYTSMAKDLMLDFVQIKDQIIDAKMEKIFSSSSTSSSSPYTPGIKVRGSSRKSQRLP
ncbi:bromodomain-containing protein 8 [Episyrphus balteatus]|uniref:bromodomain-containing protein 8 n=1 Tax=Episyrphus balteatus TaxID=286459 RepID=UPI00248658DD|nr:bromodomain-containing protein 8 [Episyrphus balteatus]